MNKRADMKFPVLLGRQTLAQAGVLVNPAANNIDKVNAYLTSKEEE